jgi:hypothetical protein
MKKILLKEVLLIKYLVQTSSSALSTTTIEDLISNLTFMLKDTTTISSTLSSQSVITPSIPSTIAYVEPSQYINSFSTPAVQSSVSSFYSFLYFLVLYFGFFFLFRFY